MRDLNSECPDLNSSVLTSRRRSVLKEWLLFVYMILLRDFGSPEWNSRSVTETGLILRLYDSFRYVMFRWYHVNRSIRGNRSEPRSGTNIASVSCKHPPPPTLTLVTQLLCKGLLVAVRYQKLQRSRVKPFLCTFFTSWCFRFQLSLSFSDSEENTSIHPWHSPDDFTCIATIWMVFL